MYSPHLSALHGYGIARVQSDDLMMIRQITSDLVALDIITGSTIYTSYLVPFVSDWKLDNVGKECSADIFEAVQTNKNGWSLNTIYKGTNTNSSN